VQGEAQGARPNLDVFIKVCVIASFSWWTVAEIWGFSSIENRSMLDWGYYSRWWREGLSEEKVGAMISIWTGEPLSGIA